jgi:hypothetical protein
LDCGSPLPLCVARLPVEKRQRAAAVHDADAQFVRPKSVFSLSAFQHLAFQPSTLNPQPSTRLLHFDDDARLLSAFQHFSISDFSVSLQNPLKPAVLSVFIREIRV